MDSHQFNMPEPAFSEKDDCSLDSEQNSIAEIEVSNFMECDASENLPTGVEDKNSESNIDKDHKASRIPRSLSCPIPNTDSSSGDESSSLSMSWSMLFEPGDSGKHFLHNFKLEFHNTRSFKNYTVYLLIL